MLQKASRPGYKRVIKNTAKFFIVAEAIAFAATYAGWYRLNTSRETRHYVKENFPAILESYYQVGEFISGDRSIRNHDELIWKQEKEAAAGR